MVVTSSEFVLLTLLVVDDGDGVDGVTTAPLVDDDELFPSKNEPHPLTRLGVVIVDAVVMIEVEGIGVFHPPFIDEEEEEDFNGVRNIAGSFSVPLLIIGVPPPPLLFECFIISCNLLHFFFKRTISEVR